MTSHDVVDGVRRRLGPGVKVGHAGTLDPFATGLLLVLVGGATRVQRFLLTLPKTYRAVARLGWLSDTGDRDGRLTLAPKLETVFSSGQPAVWSMVQASDGSLYLG